MNIVVAHHVRTILHCTNSGCEIVAGVLGAMLMDDEAGRVKLTRVAIAVGRVS